MLKLPLWMRVFLNGLGAARNERQTPSPPAYSYSKFRDQAEAHAIVKARADGPDAGAAQR